MTGCSVPRGKMAKMASAAIAEEEAQARPRTRADAHAAEPSRPSCRQDRLHVGKGKGGRLSESPRKAAHRLASSFPRRRLTKQMAASGDGEIGARRQFSPVSGSSVRPEIKSKESSSSGPSIYFLDIIAISVRFLALSFAMMCLTCTLTVLSVMFKP